MEARFARIISVIFQPLLIPFYSVLLIFSLQDYVSLIIPLQAKQMILVLVFTIAFVFPALFIFMLYKNGIIKSVEMNDRRERIFPLIITTIFYFILFQIMRRLHLPEIYIRLFLGSAVIVAITLMVSLFWKISAHMMGIGGMLGGVIGISQVILVGMAGWVALVVICCGLVGFARLKLMAHSPPQVYTGFIVGFVCMLGFIIV